MKVQPVPYDEDCGIISPLVADLIACDHCGIVAVDTPQFGWKRWTDEQGAQHHHCPQAAEYNEWVRYGLVHMVAPETAVEYEQWGEPEPEQPAPQPDPEPVEEQTESPTAATDADFRLSQAPPLPVMTVPDNPIFAPANQIDLGDDPDGDCEIDPRDT